MSASESDFEWLQKMVALEEERGDIVPGGAGGGAGKRIAKGDKSK